MSIRISVAIQHHPARPGLPKRLRRALNEGRRNRQGTMIEVVHDPDPAGERNPWRCARECWARTPDSCTHRLVIQDDVVPCKGFLRLAHAALEARPERIVAFYVGMNATLTYRAMLVAAAQCESWVQGSVAGWVPALALAVPSDLVDSLVGFDDGTTPIADDEVYGRWTRTNELPWFATIPSLVDHDDAAPSLMRSEHARGRRAPACWIGDADPSLIDWTRG